MKRTDQSHPGLEALERFMRLELSRAEVLAIVRHLLTGCPRCLGVTRRFWRLAERRLRDTKKMPASEVYEKAERRYPRAGAVWT